MPIKEVTGFLLQESPKVYIASVPGRWLLERTTPSWRIKDPIKGFQRMVNESRARQIAVAVLDQGRTFPNAIVLATDIQDFKLSDCTLQLDVKTLFLVVDGQHRLWAQNYSSYEANYSCVIHTGLSEVKMAELFLEINDNQKRVPASLRWDLVRLVRPDDDPFGIAAVEILFLLATEKSSPFFQRIDLTGEQSELQVKQGSLAPEIRRFLSKTGKISDQPFDLQYEIVLHYSKAIEAIDGDNWGEASSPFYKARVLRALFRLLTDIVDTDDFDPGKFSYRTFMPFLKKINTAALATEEIRATQGSAGIKAIYDEIYKQVF